MNQKPEFLKGEVKEFITEFNDSVTFFRDKFHTQVELSPKGAMLQIADFYSQLFSPDKMKYFKGWTKDKQKDYLYTSECGHRSISFSADKATVEFRGLYTISVLSIKLTLSQAITCCNLADIKLEWKE